MTNKITLNHIWKVLIAVPLFIGMIGLIKDGVTSITDALYGGLQLYLLNGDADAANLYLDIARWTAPAMTASGIFLIFQSLRTRFINWKTGKRKNSTAVYGEPAEIEPILKDLGNLGIVGKEDIFVSANRYIIMYPDDEKNIDFYRQFQEELTGKSVYLKCEHLCPQVIDNPSIKLFSFSDSFARRYWQKADILKDSVKKNYEYTIVFIGFGLLGEKLLVQGLQTNIFSAQQHITYHIFGDNQKFRGLHHELGSIAMDDIIFHEEPWYQMTALIETSDRVILADENMNNIRILNDLAISCPNQNLDVLNADKSLLSLFFKTQNVSFYEFTDETNSLSYIINEDLLEDAKQLNLKYAVLYDNAASNDETKELRWQNLNAFTRYSNISSVDYHKVRMKLLNFWAEESIVKQEELSGWLESSHMERLAELEHIRWCRYHFLSNWKYGILENGKEKDAKKCIHMNLIPYQELSEAAKEKNRETIRLMMCFTESNAST